MNLQQKLDSIFVFNILIVLPKDPTKQKNLKLLTYFINTMDFHVLNSENDPNNNWFLYDDESYILQKYINVGYEQ